MQRKGFTLLEVLIGVAIIAVVASVGFVSYGKAMSIARDYKRKEDIKKIVFALELYHTKNNTYPAGSPLEASSLDAQPWINGLVPGYIANLPTDPLNQNGYLYFYMSGDMSAGPLPCPGTPFFLLMTLLENSGDKESLANNPNTYWCDGTTRLLDMGFPPNTVAVVKGL